MGGKVTSLLRAYADWDIESLDGDRAGGDSFTPEPRKAESPERSFSPTRHLAKPRSPLAASQIEKAWQEFTSVCSDPDRRQTFDIEHDLELQTPVRIAFLDTGICQDHDAVVGKVSRVRNFVPKGVQSDASADLTVDRNGHGTFCVALAIGGVYSATPDEGGVHEPCFANGVAPFSKAIVGKVLDDQRHGDPEWLVRGLRWACDIDRVDKRRPVNADIICITTSTDKYIPELRDVILRALSRGKIIVCAASNMEDETYQLEYPAKFGDVICVGSHSENGQPTGFTPGGREVDFLGPGDKVWSASSTRNDHVTTMRGMGVSAAYIAGICALILAYAEKLGGQELRSLISNTHMMREVLRRMASLPGQHDNVAGYGNIMPLRLLKFGPQMIMDELYAMVKQHTAYVPDPRLKVQVPLQIHLVNYTAANVASAIPQDTDAVKKMIKPIVKDHMLHVWFKGLRDFFFALPTLSVDIFEPELDPDTRFTNADLSLPEQAFAKLTTTLDVSGVNVQNIIHTYLQNSWESLTELILPEYRHISYLGGETLFRKLRPRLVSIPGDTPLHYLLEVAYLLGNEGKYQHRVSILVDNLNVESLDNMPPKLARNYETMLRNICAKPRRCDIFVQNCTGSTSASVVQSILQACSGKFHDAFFGSLEMKPGEDKPIWYAHSELYTEDPNKGRLSPEANNELNTEETTQSFKLWHELQAYLDCPERLRVLAEYDTKGETLKKTIAVGYQRALNLCKNAIMAEKVTCLDLRMNELTLEAPEVNLDSVSYEAASCLRIPRHMTKSKSNKLSDPRKADFSTLFQHICEQNTASFSILEMALPPLSFLKTLSTTFQSQLFKYVKDLYISGQVQSPDLLCILRTLPKGDYPLNIHIQHLILCSASSDEKSRDFDPPAGVHVIVYDCVVSEEFFNISDEAAVTTVFEICMNFSSLQLLQEVKLNCEMFLEGKGNFLCHYLQLEKCIESCHGLLKCLNNALDENMVYGESVLRFSREIFKYDIMFSSVGKGRLRRAFKPQEKSPPKLPENTYIQNLVQRKAVNSAIKNLKINTVTVAVLGFGINAMHAEFKGKAVPLRDFSREKAGLPFGEKIVALGYNSVPEETMASFMDDGVTIGTVAAALIAGNNCGAAPFANILSLKVGTTSGRVTQHALTDGLAWMMEREDQDLLPPADIVYIPFNFRHYDPDLYRLVNKMAAAGKIIICSSGRGRSREETRGVYPASFGDVICISSHNLAGELSRTSGRGRSVDLVALGELPGLKNVLSDMWAPSIAAAQVTGVVAYTLAYAEMIGGPSLRQAVSNNHVMRQILHQMCTKPGQHDESTGFGRIDPNLVFKHGEEFFQTLVSESTEEYDEILVRRPAARRVTLAIPSACLYVRYERSASFNEKKPDLETIEKLRKSISPPVRRIRKASGGDPRGSPDRLAALKGETRPRRGSTGNPAILPAPRHKELQSDNDPYP